MEFKNIANLINQRKFAEAKNSLIELIKKDKKLVNKLPNLEKKYENIYFTLSQVCNQLNELNDSKNYLKKHIQYNPKDCEALLNLANLQLRTREIKDIEKNYKKILRINKNYLPAIINLAFFYEGIGKIKNAQKYYEFAKKIKPHNLSFHYNLIRLNSNYLSDKKINFIKKVIKENKVLKKNEFLANLILSKDYEKNKDYLNEIKFLNLSHQSFLKYNINKKSHEYWLKIIPYYYNKLIYKNLNKKNLKNINPIFIIGLPRSGSTITELILSTSKTPKYDLGETSIINYNLLHNYGDQLFNNPKKDKIEIDVNFIREKIVSSFKNFNIPMSDNTTIIDKSLENFFYIDLIIKIFPKAKFIITERNINDNIIGIYKKVLLDIPWAHSISSIINYIDNYKNIIHFYKKKYEEKLYVIKLEDLQNLNKDKIENLFKFCGLKFNDRYFEFKENHQFVNNASNIQIRNNLGRYDKEKYKRYFNILNQFKDKHSWIE
ncbi:sulfotransferase [Candidatus Pelagibacter sp.]|nr:sulfotransferase [Candidatus Pelagibacter sp.]